MKRTFICLLGIFALAAAGAPAAVPSGTEITAAGTGIVVMPPNLATVGASIDTTADRATDAVSQNNTLYDRVIAAAEKAGVSRNDIALDNYYVRYNPRPVNPSANDGEARYGYSVSRAFSVRVRNINKAGAVSDACLGAGATAINGIDFGISDQTAARILATSKAVADARANAQALAAAAGMHIVAIKSMQFGGELGATGFKTIARVSTRAVPTEFDQAPVNVTISVTIVYLARA